ncbi:heterokaryon incompatibility protein-domain-containing protein [Nemania sp. NC0429]|nr:heterokaryon incompatibility protein-domain-containing protein [Nemania sp. NC0429]
MTILTTRWHDSTCPGPRINFEEHGSDCDVKDTCHFLPQSTLVPHCVACGRKPLLHDIISERVNLSRTFDVQPEDKPFGQLNLYWPSEALYGRSTVLSTPKKATHEQALSHVYPTTLRPDQFRQACLSPTDSENFEHTQLIRIDPEDFPVHLTLETYDDNNFPEYEAFSYTWQGEHPEQGNESYPYHPVYTGPSWDVLIQTKNCWELLRFARLPHTPRQIWVDAVCINQSSMEEKAQQVAKMGHIYRESSRVVVYLGPDVAVKPKHRFPRRHRLDQFASGEVRPLSSDGSVMDLDIEKLFQRRYFTRLWVIQELVVAPKTVIRIGDTDLSVDSIAIKRLEKAPGWSWAKTTAAWFRHVTSQTLGTDPCEALELVSHANCSDLRDRLFGILHLMNHEDTNDQGLKVDYSISSQHVWIGFFAHCLFRLNIFWFLIYASGPRASLGNRPFEPWIPSWVPDWTSPLTWERFSRPQASCHSLGGEVAHALMLDSPDPYLHRSLQKPLTLARLISGNNAESRIFWNQEASVDSKTGTLQNVRAIHLLAIPSTPKLQTRLGVYGVYEIALDKAHRREKSRQKLYFVSEKPLDREILPLHDHLYVLETEKDLQFLVLRDSDGPLPFSSSQFGPRYCNMAAHKNFSLVTAEPYTYLGINPEMCKHLGLISTSKFAVNELGIEYLPQLLTVRQLIDDVRALLNQQVKFPWDRNARYLVEHFFRIDLAINSIEYFILPRLLPDRNCSDLLPVFWKLADEFLVPETCSDEDLGESYIDSFNPIFQPAIRDGYVHFQCTATDHDRIFGGHETRSNWELYAQSPSEVFYLRAPLSQVLLGIRHNTFFRGMARCMVWLRRVFDTNNLGELQELLAYPHERLDNCKVEEKFPGFAVDGDAHIINIH